MTHRHVDDERLAAFIEGTLGDDAAALVALHLDDCPGCAARAIAEEPLGAAFASVDDPVVPRGLAAESLRLAALAPPRRAGWLEGLLAAPREVAAPRSALPAELVVGSMLIAAATALAWLGGEPTSAGLRIARLGRLAWDLARVAGAGVPVAVVLPLAVVVGFAAVVLLRRADEDDVSTAIGGAR